MKFRDLKIISIAVAWSLIASQHLDAQQILTALQTHFKKYPQEKVYVQTDKEVYSTGQTIWYKIYATAYGTDATLSRIVHIQLIDTNGKIILQNKLLLVNGNAHGDILLPDSLRNNFYQLRCFTAWMLNFDESFVFHKTIYVKNLSETTRDQAVREIVRERYAVQFFPEGGDLIDGIGANVAFKSTNQFGLPVDVYGEIRDDAQHLVDSFRTFHDGMGEFSFRPLAGHSYYAIVHLPNDTEKNIPLPEVKNSGIGVRVIEQTQDALLIHVVYHEIIPGQFQDLTLIAHQQNGKIATYDLALSPGANLFNIKKGDFANGILRLTFFDKNSMPLAERVVFLHTKDELHLMLHSDTVSFKSKAKSVFTLQVKGADWKVDKTTLSLSVTDADRVMRDSAGENIYSSLLLTSELKGQIHNPSYYFTSDADSVKNALDLVMLTNGWRHFEWKQIFTNDAVGVNYPVEDFLHIAGEIVGYDPGEKKEHFFKLLIQQGDSIRFVGYISPDSTGRFILKDYSFPGLSTVFFKDENPERKNKKFKVRFYDNPTDTVTGPGNFILTPQTGVTAINEFMRTTWNSERDQSFLHKKGDLKSITIRGRVPTPSELLIKRYVSQNFEQGNAHDIDLINNFYPNSLSLFDFLKGRFPGLVIYGPAEHPSFSFRNSAANELVPVRTSTNGVNDMVTTSEPYIYINEIPSSIPAVRDIPLSDIAVIRFIAPPASMAPLNGGAVGVLAIYLKKEPGSFKSLDFANTYNQYIFHGYSVSREFYSPDYSKKDSAYFLPDNRETLYWNPDLQPGSDNKIHFSFYNSDHAKKIRIVAEGMDEQGRLLSITRIVNENE
jgi:hypothetical protein